ncbi:MAG: glucose-6-phosphate dehydrogenase assembly protein OpcA, partial [Polyangiaceae bacterium]
HLGRAESVVTQVARAHPSRTIMAMWSASDTSAITADVALHRVASGGPACGDAITVEATGQAREWLPENADRLALPDLPVCVWWVGDLPDYDRLFDRMAVAADLVIVNSGEMDLRDLEKLSNVVARARGTCAVSDLTWIRLRPLQNLIARFFDDAAAAACLRTIDKVTIEFAPRQDEKDVASTQAGLLLGWMASALSLRCEGVKWLRGAGWAEATLGGVVARLVQRPRSDVPPGSVLLVSIESAPAARFEIERQDDPLLVRWSRDTPAAPMPPQVLRVAMHEEATLLVRCLERPRRDPLFERSLHAGSLIVRPVAPRLSTMPGPGGGAMSSQS